MSGGSIEVHRPEKCRELDLFGQEFEGREDGLDLSSVRPASRVVVVGYAWPAGADPLTDKLCCCPIHRVLLNGLAVRIWGDRSVGKLDGCRELSVEIQDGCPDYHLLHKWLMFSCGSPRKLVEQLS